MSKISNLTFNKLILIMKGKVIIFLMVIFCFFACTSNSEKQNDNSPENTSSTSDNVQSNSSNDSDEENDGNSDYEPGCKFEDGTYSANVDYNNSETGYSATYTLDVEVQNCQIVQINFPNDGYLDSDHISYADIDEDGNASVEGEDGKTYEIQIDN